MEEEGLSLQDLRELRYEWKALTETPGYKRLLQYAKEQELRRVAELREPDCKHVDFLRGECAGITLFSSMAEIELARLEAEIEMELKVLEDLEEETPDEDFDIGPNPDAAP